MKELRASTDEQKTMIFSIFDRVTKLQSLLLSEVSWLYTVLFYAGCLFAVYLATATKRTADARLWLFCILSANVVMERLICSLTLVENDPDPFEVYGNDDNTPQALLHSRIWIARKIALMCSCLVLAYVALTFKDYNIINYQLLQDIRKQNADLCKAMQLMKSGVAPVSSDVLDAKNSQDADDEYSDDDDDDNASFDSTQTDATWRQDRLSEVDDNDYDSDLTDIVEEEDLSFDTAKTTPNNNEDNFKLSETAPVILNVDSFDKPTPKRRGRPPGSKNSSRAGTPLRSIDGHHGYNLRKRNANATFNGFSNSPLQGESVSDFAKSIFNMAKASQVRSYFLYSSFSVDTTILILGSFQGVSKGSSETREPEIGDTQRPVRQRRLIMYFNPSIISSSSISLFERSKRWNAFRR